MSEEEKVLWRQDRETVGFFLMPQRERVLDNLEWDSVEEALKWWHEDVQLRQGLWKKVEADSTVGELAAYEGQKVPCRMVLIRLDLLEQMKTEAFHARKRRMKADGRWTESGRS